MASTLEVSGAVDGVYVRKTYFCKRHGGTIGFLIDYLES
jgi:hypothetical protein